MFRRVLFATDFSRVAEKACDYLRKCEGIEKVILLHVLNEHEMRIVSAGPGWVSEFSDEYDSAIERRMRANAEEELQKRAEAFREAGISVTTVVATGTPQTEILACASREGASLIVIGSHGRSDPADAVLGSVAGGVLRRARVPVLVVGREVRVGEMP